MGEATEPTARKTCFVVCPIGAEGSSTRRHADWLYHEIIECVLDLHFKNKFVVTRADKIDTPGMIDAQIIEHLLDDDLVIADMSELNANAFYEMGIRHMKELPIIHMYKRGETIPFDVKLYRAIQFDYGDPADLKLARAALTAAIAAVIDVNYKADNPVIRARGVVSIPESATPEVTILQQQIDSLTQKVSRLIGGQSLETYADDFSIGSVSVTLDRRYGSIERAKATDLLTNLANKFFRSANITSGHHGITVEFSEKMPASNIEDFSELALGVTGVRNITVPPRTLETK